MFVLTIISSIGTQYWSFFIPDSATTATSQHIFGIIVDTLPSAVGFVYAYSTSFVATTAAAALLDWHLCQLLTGLIIALQQSF